MCSTGQQHEGHKPNIVQIDLRCGNTFRAVVKCKYFWVQRVSGLKSEAHHSSKQARCGADEKQSIKILLILVCGASSKLSWNGKPMWDRRI